AALVFGASPLLGSRRARRWIAAVAAAACVALLVLSQVRNGEVNTITKFLVNSGERSSRADPHFNNWVLGGLRWLRPADGERLAAKFRRDNPGVREYELYAKLYESLRGDSAQRGRALGELMAAVIASDRPLDDHARQDINAYVLGRLGE